VTITLLELEASEEDVAGLRAGEGEPFGRELPEQIVVVVHVELTALWQGEGQDW